MDIPHGCVDGVSHRYLVDVEAEVEDHGYLADGDSKISTTRSGERSTPTKKFKRDKIIFALKACLKTQFLMPMDRESL